MLDLSEAMKTLPFRLYHYTSQEGFLGIIESDCVWATKMQYLNDTTELSLALKLTKEAIVKYASKYSGIDLSRIEQLKGALNNISKINLCIASFSEKPDLLSQWRAYSGGSGGYSIGFNTEALIKNAEKSDFRLKKCIYNPIEQHKK